MTSILIAQGCFGRKKVFFFFNFFAHVSEYESTEVINFDKYILIFDSFMVHQAKKSISLEKKHASFLLFKFNMSNSNNNVYQRANSYSFGHFIIYFNYFAELKKIY